MGRRLGQDSGKEVQGGTRNVSLERTLEIIRLHSLSCMLLLIILLLIPSVVAPSILEVYVSFTLYSAERKET